MELYKRGGHTVWDRKYYIVWVTKYRYPVSVAIPLLASARTSVAAAAQYLLKLFFENRFDRRANVRAQPILNRTVAFF